MAARTASTNLLRIFFNPQLASRGLSLKRCASTSTSPRSVIVTGAGQGIGKGIALRLAQDGFDVCVNDLKQNSSLVESTVSEIQQLGRKSIAVYADVAKKSEVEEMVQTSVNELGPLSVFVANAGIAHVQRVTETTEADMQRMFSVNVHGVVHCDQAAAKQFIKQGSGGKIINAASIVSFKPFYLLPMYSASKAAVRSLTQTFAQELARHKITVNAYAPGIVNSSMWDLIDEQMSSINGLPKGENFKANLSTIALGRTSVPEDVAKMVSFLAGPDSDYVTGQTMIVDGGVVFS